MEPLLRSTRPLAFRPIICEFCQNALRNAATPVFADRVGLQNSNRICRRFKGYIAPEGQQARPITGYYAEMLKKPLSRVQPLTRTAHVPQPAAEEPPISQKEQTLAKAAIIFGSKKALAERRQEIDSASRNIAGVMVPQKPEEPDNCCMSGCVNCVWDMYRDEMEEWAEKSAQARLAMQAQRSEAKGSGTMLPGQEAPSHVRVSMDDDRGGSETNWSGNVDQDKLFDDIPVGIREFMRTEKKLKQMHKKEAIDPA